MLELGVCYYPEQWPEEMWADDARNMVDLGLNWVRIAEFSWALVEPEEGQFNWDWLDRAVKVLGEAGLKVVMCTPTAAPPKWLVDKHSEMLPVDENGQVRKFGARRHYCFSSDIYREHAVRIATEFAKRYGQNPFVHAWQIDNEYGDHNTIRSYSDAAQSAFRDWLKARYQTIDQLNEAWGTCFWGMAYQSFAQVDLPLNLVEEPSPTHLLDFYRFSSDQVVRFNKAQVDVLRAHSPGRPITHNFMGHHTDFDHYALGADIDFASWDSYPMGALIYSGLDEDKKRELLRAGLPDQPAFNDDLYRRVGNGKAWIMEQQPGPVNWAAYNQAPQDGMVRLWTWLAFAHGLDVVCYFRWRQSKFAQEQFHAGLMLPNNQPDQAYYEVKQVAEEIKQLPQIEARQPAQVALVLDYTSRWAAEVLPQGTDYSSAKLGMGWYSAFMQQGIEVDIVSPDDDLRGYKLTIVPDAIIDNEQLVSRLNASETKVFLGPRTGSKTKDMHIPDHLPPGSFAQLVDVQVERVESLPKYHDDQIELDGKAYPLGHWREHLRSSEPVLALVQSRYRNGAPVLVGNQKCWYAAVQFEGNAQAALVQKLIDWASLVGKEKDLGQLRFAQRGSLHFAFNFSDLAQTITVPSGAKLLVGDHNVPPRGVTIWAAK